jgi:predicted transcriptional regulator YdeE/uncharacterized protein YndB with AHSA1/START domain
MPKLNISKSIIIDAPVEKVFNAIDDFHTWSHWSPWLIQDPDAKVDVAADGKSYSWVGKRVGSGNMKITGEQKNGTITCDLNFLKPWKSFADVRFTTFPSESGTKVTWFMNSSLPWFMFWMKKRMVAFVGMDYERGLNMLKDYVEDGEVHSRLDFKGYSDFPGCKYIAYKTSSFMETVGEDMTRDFEKIWAFMDGKTDLISGYPFSIYHKFDMVKGGVSYTSGVPVSSIPADLPEGMITGEIPATKIYTLEHTGSYRHLGNAWTTMHGMMRLKEFKGKRGIHPFETYVNNPGEVPENELITRINFAVK